MCAELKAGQPCILLILALGRINFPDCKPVELIEEVELYLLRRTRRVRAIPAHTHTHTHTNFASFQNVVGDVCGRFLLLVILIGKTPLFFFVMFPDIVQYVEVSFQPCVLKVSACYHFHMYTALHIK